MRALTPRLDALLSLLRPAQCLGDIGSDHAFLICAAVMQGKAKRGVAVERHEDPYRQSQKTVLALGLEGVVAVRLGDGLEPLAPGDADALCIAGMGGGTIKGILERGQEKLRGIKQLVLQPNTDATVLRAFLQECEFRITAELVVEDAGLLYQVLRAEQGREECPLTSLELEYGRGNLQTLAPTTKLLLERDLRHWREIFDGLRHAKQEGAELRRQWIGKRILEIQEVLAVGEQC